MRTKTQRKMVDFINNPSKYNAIKSITIVNNYFKELQETLDKLHKGAKNESKEQ